FIFRIIILCIRIFVQVKTSKSFRPVDIFGNRWIAKTEILDEVGKVRQGATLVGVGIALASVGSIFLVAMMAELLVEIGGLERWLAYLCVGWLFATIGVGVLYLGIRRLNAVDPIPRETIDSVRKDMSWPKEQSPSDRT
ncbi:MAG: phage holin family protein, partial [Chloroflexales bacterium]|nr:phage holin family protein [Chloroflexales bacterium]